MSHSKCGSDCHSFQLTPYKWSDVYSGQITTYFSKNHFVMFNKAIGKHKQ